METETIIRRCSESGATLLPDGYRLRVKGWSRLSPQLKETLRTHKAEVMETLADLNPWAIDAHSSELMAWAAEVSERELVTPEAVSYVESPERVISTDQISLYAIRYLQAIVTARLHRNTGCWGEWTPRWWEQREKEALEALEALRRALGDASRGA